MAETQDGDRLGYPVGVTVRMVGDAEAPVAGRGQPELHRCLGLEASEMLGEASQLQSISSGVSAAIHQSSETDDA